MAIKLATFGGGSPGVISLSYNRGRQDDGKLTIERLKGAGGGGSAGPGLQGWGAGFKLLSSMTSDNPEASTITEEFIGNSYKLDVFNIVLYKRGIGGDCTFTASKNVVVPTASFSFQGGAGEFTFGQKTISISVQRQKACSTSGPIFGEEEWASNPCQPSSASYNCGEALDYIKGKVPGILFPSSEGRCSFEGSFRSVLSSMAGLVAGGGWKFGSGGACSEGPPDKNCSTYYKKTGTTLEGAFSSATWLYSRVSGATRSGRATVTVYEIAYTSPEKHHDYPSEDDFIQEMVPQLSKWKAIVEAQANRPNSLKDEFGIDITANYTLTFALTWSALLALNTVDIFDFIKTFGIDYELLLNISGGMGLGWGSQNPFWVRAIASGFKREFRNEAFAQMGVDQDFPEFIKIYGGWQVQDVKTKLQKNAELFYPAPALNTKKFIVNASETTFASKTTNVVVSPSPERREIPTSTRLGFNPPRTPRSGGGDSQSNQSTVVKTGVWRSVQATILEGSEGRSNFLPGGNDGLGSESETWNAAIGGAIKEVSPEILRYLIDGKSFFHRKVGGFKRAIDAGFKIFAVGRPPGSISVNCGGSAENSYDLSSVGGKLGQDQIVEAEASGDGEPLVDEDAASWDDPCEDLVQIATDEADTTGVPLVYGAEYQDEASGIVDAKGVKCSANVEIDTFASSRLGLPKAQFSWVLPSLADMKWVIKTEYQFSASVRGVTNATNIWTQYGSSSGDPDLVLSHTLNISEIGTADSGPVQSVTFPSPGSSDGPVYQSEYQFNGFYIPDCIDLESMSATLQGGQGLVVTYRLQQARPQFGVKSKLIVPKVTEATIRT